MSGDLIAIGAVAVALAGIFFLLALAGRLDAAWQRHRLEQRWVRRELDELEEIRRRRARLRPRPYDQEHSPLDDWMR